MRYGLSVIGNGPVGCYTAMCAQKHTDVALIGPKVDKVRCAGLISHSGLTKLDLVKGDHVLNKVTGCRIFSPKGTEIHVDAKKPMALVVDRIAFDKNILGMAQDAGVTYLEDWVTSVNGGISTKSGQNIVSDTQAIAAGAFYSLQHDAGMPTPKEYLVGGQYEMKVECEPDIVELRFDLPDFFSWIIPVDGYARIGLCTKGNPRPHLDNFVAKLKSQGRIRSNTRISESFGVIPQHDPKMPTQHGHIRLVGDAAGQVKATTGGGVVLGCLSGTHILESNYDQSWRDDVGGELRMHLMIHRFIRNLSPEGKDRFFKLVSDYNSTLIETGDMDFAQKTVISMAKNPGFALRSLPFMHKILKAVISAFL